MSIDVDCGFHIVAGGEGIFVRTCSSRFEEVSWGGVRLMMVEGRRGRGACEVEGCGGGDPRAVAHCAWLDRVTLRLGLQRVN